MLEYLKTLEPLLIAILPALLVVWLGYRIWLVKYLTEKINELILKRYLENGVDKTLAGVDHALAVHNENYRRGVSLIEEFRGAKNEGIKLRKTTIEKGFIDYDIKYFTVVPFYKIKVLVRDNIYWDSYQLLYAFVGKSYNFLENDLKLAIEGIESGLNLKVPVDVFCDKYLERLKELQTESFKYYKIQLELFNIAMALELNLLKSGKLSFKDIKTFKDRQEIKKGIKHLKDVFGKEANKIKKIMKNL